MADINLEQTIQSVFSEAERKANKAFETFKVEKLAEMMRSDANSVDGRREGLSKTDQKKLDAILGGDSGSQNSTNALSNTRFSTLVHRQSSHVPHSFAARVVIEYRAIVAQPAHEHFSVKEITELLWDRLVELAKDPKIENRPFDVIGSVDYGSIQLKNKSVTKKNISDKVFRREEKRRLEGGRF